MEFNLKALSKSRQWFKPWKFSIRLSIFTIVLLLLLGVSATVITIDYFTIRSILIITTKEYITQASSKAVAQIQRYLQPLNSRLSIASHIINNKIIKPEQTEFTKLLHGLIADNENLAALYWGDKHGNLYLLNKNKNGFYAQTIRSTTNQTTKEQLDPQGKIISATKIDHGATDPSLRPWYQQAQNTKDRVWIVYRFLEIDTQQPQLGVTSALPIYDTQGVLMGVLGVDMLLNTLSNYIKSIKITPNSFIFIVNSHGAIIAAHSKQQQQIKFIEQPDITDINLSWVFESFNTHKQQPPDLPFTFKHKGSPYIAIYKSIPTVKTVDPWMVAIVTPVSDVIAPLVRNVMISSIITAICLLIGIIFATIFSIGLSRPIKQLAEDADQICKLHLDNITYVPSKIKEVANMMVAFIRMKNVLRSFQRYLPMALVRNLMASNKVAVVGGEEKELTLLFTDIKDFTTLAENFAPEKLMQYLSEYFQNISKVIIEMHGTIDKYVGDGIVAFWGAPLDDAQHVLHACQATLKIQQVLKQLNANWQTMGIPQAITRFGINLGRVIVGNVGSEDRLCYTSLGDSVNLASRLEGLNKVYGTNIIVSEYIYEQAKNHFQFRPLDKVAVKGKTHGVYIYELVEDRKTTKNTNWDTYNTKS